MTQIYPGWWDDEIMLIFIFNYYDVSQEYLTDNTDH